jgi:glucose/arabinose dehydrogenase
VKPRRLLLPTALLVAFVSGCSAGTRDGGLPPGDTGSIDTGVSDASADAGSDASPADATARDADASAPMDATAMDADAGTPPYDAGPRPDAAFFCDLGQDAPGLTVPQGFCMRRFATVPCPRNIRFAPNGDLFVASPGEFTPGGAPQGMSSIIVLPDDNEDGVADGLVTYEASLTLKTVHGLLFRANGTELLYTVGDGVWSLPYHSGDRQLAGGAQPTQIADLSNPPVQRWTHTIAEALDGTLYVTRGQYDSTSCPTNTRYGAVLRIGGTSAINGDVVVTGMRDPMHMRCTKWGACFAAELTGDAWQAPASEKLVLVHDGDNIGYPCCYDHNVPNPDIMPVPDCSGVTPGIIGIPVRYTPFGFDWDHENMWPAPYTGGFFVAQHGEFGSWTGAGVTWSPTDATTHYPTMTPTPFITGFALAGGVSGRPADVTFAPDGRMFIADDQGGAIYWVAPRTLRRP